MKKKLKHNRFWYHDFLCSREVSLDPFKSEMGTLFNLGRPIQVLKKVHILYLQNLRTLIIKS